MVDLFAIVPSLISEFVFGWLNALPALPAM